MIARHYLTIHPWTPDFSPVNHSISQVVSWVRIPGLPTKYYKKNVIRAIGKTLGHVLRIDYNTASGERGKFARMAVILDLAQPLTSKIIVDGKDLLVEYEGLSIICYSCGRYGHLVEACPLALGNKEEAAPTTILADSIRSQPERVINATDIREDKPYGEWMIAPKGRRFNKEPKRKTEAINQIGVTTKSRFDPLHSFDAQPDNSDSILPLSKNVSKPLARPYLDKPK